MDDAFYLIMFGVRRQIPSETTYNNLFRDDCLVHTEPPVVWFMLGSALSEQSSLLIDDGTRIVYLFTDGILYEIPAEDFISPQYCFDISKAQRVPDSMIAELPHGPVLN
jgi:hypothetical protein